MALHLEWLRLRNAQLEVGGAGSSSGSSSDDRSVRLLKDNTIFGAENIGCGRGDQEVLDELRCIAADENE